MEIENKIHDIQSRQNDKEDVLKMIKERINKQNDKNDNEYDSQEEEKLLHSAEGIYNQRPKNLEFYINKYKDNNTKQKSQSRKKGRRREFYNEEDDDESYRKQRVKKKNYMFEQQRELDELKEDINLEIKRLMRTNNVEDLEEIMQEIDNIKYDIKKEKGDLMRNPKNPEFNKLLDSIVTLKNDIDKKLSHGSNENNKRLNILRDEFKGFKDDVNEKVDTLEKKQIQQLFGLKYILENDPYIKNKEKIEYIFSNDFDKPTQVKAFDNTDINKSMKELNNKHVEKTSHLLEEKVTDRNHPELKTTDRNHPSKNESNPLKINEKNNKKQKENHSEKNSTPISKKQRTPSEKYISKKKSNLTKLQKLRSNVYVVIAINRVKLIIQRAKKTLSNSSLKYFAANFEKIDNSFRLYVFSYMKKVYQNIINHDTLNIDLTEKIGFLKKKDIIQKKKFDIIIGYLNEIINSFNEIINEKNITKNFLEYLLFLISNNSYIPRKFFCYFELLRLEFNSGTILSNVSNEQQLMILSFFIIDNKFLKTKFMKEKAIKNVKIISSILYFAIIELYSALPKISKEIKPVKNTTPKKKSVFSKKNNDDNQDPKEENDSSKAKNKKFDKYDPQFDKAYEQFQKHSKDESTKAEEELVNTLNSKLPSYTPDTQIDDLEFLQEKLFKKEEIKDFYDLSKVNNYNISAKIKVWSEKLQKMVLKQLDDVDEDENENKDDE